VIDLCFSSGTITNNIVAHEIRPESTSDHTTCTIYLNLTPPKATPKRAWCRADWTLFQKTITGSGLDLSNINNAEEALRAATNVTRIINDATNAAIPWVRPRTKQAPWWHRDLDTLRRQLIRAERRHRNNRTNNQLQLYAKTVCNKWKTTVQLAKEKYWTTPLQKTDPQNIWKCLRPSDTHHKPLTPLEGVTDFQGKCDIL
jgi:hypothetical protein